MALKKINENPKITDTILIEIECPDGTGCFTTNPYKVDSVIIYYVERNFNGLNFGEYTKVTIPENLELKYKEQEKLVCNDPSPDNIAILAKIKLEIESASQQTKIYYKDRSAIKVIGSQGYPAWIGTDIENSPLTLESTDSNGNVQYGHFSYEWEPNGSIREGDYFICWTWTPLPDGEKLSAHIPFIIEGDGKAVSIIPSHLTATNKYETLLERYLPEMYKCTLAETDITPQVIDTFNQAVAKGFTFLEDMANQIIDLFDANALHESLLSYLSNLFAIKLRSSDPTLWRRQIKEAIPLFKKKGTLGGLKEAFAQSGMVLNSFTQYWQLVSPYTYVEVFKVVDSAIFKLEKTTLINPDPQNFELSLKRHGETDFVVINSENVSFDNTHEDGIIRMTWVGDQLSMGGLSLYEGDQIKVMYQYRSIDSVYDQSLENYIRLLPLKDLRNEDEQQYPVKNWNIKLIAEDDPMFNVLIPVRHPFADPIQFGWERTEFAYSENIYNAEEYNGSTRPTFDPCKIDKEFLDPCGACISSSYSVDIGIEEFSNDRILEAQEILNEFTPFHAQIHTINFSGEINEFIQPPVEQIDTLITYDYLQSVISGNANPLFYRNMEGAQTNWVITREDLTDQITLSSGNIGLAYNDHVLFISPDNNLKSLGIKPLNHILEILAPSLNTGTYTISDYQENIARVSSTTIEPLDQTAFTFRLSNVIYGNFNSTILQKDLVKLVDNSLNFDVIGVKTQWDVTNTPDYTGGPWKISIPAYSSTYEIIEIVEGVLIIDGNSTLPTSSVTNVVYNLVNDLDEIIESSTTGNLNITRRGEVNLNDAGIIDVNEIIKKGDYLFFDGNEYLVSEINGKNFYIMDYVDGDAVGVQVHNRRRLIENGVGYFGYKGIHLITAADHEAEYGMVNGKNSPVEDLVTDDSHFYQNYMFQIGDEFYKISYIDGSNVILEGREQDFMTFNAGGTSVEYSVVHFPKKEVNVGFTVFDQLDHSGHTPVIREIYSTIDQNTAVVALSASKNSGVQENANQEEGISFIVENRNGQTIEGEL